ncbi:MAG: ChbG/HpnK family deacetylase [Candidatus Yanofskybacteria bacterium]|nr:ChbG/HpnK family deacetylase [Candidatus Yanofskybacteria bacterium]
MTGNSNLKIIADDMGLHKSVNDGIIFLLKEGKIDGASLMANGEEFEDAAKQISDAGLGGIGAHLNLVEQRSVVSGELMHANHRIFFLKYVLGLVKQDYIWQELEAQVKKIIQTGVKLSFINGNQHLHLLPGIMDMCIKLAGEYGIPYIRIVNEPVNLSGGKFFRKLQLLFLNFLSAAAKKKIRKAGLQCNDFFVGFVSAGNMSDSDIKYAEDLAQKYPDKIVELGCHPGYENEDLKTKFKHWVGYNWQGELTTLSKLKVES